MNEKFIKRALAMIKARENYFNEVWRNDKVNDSALAKSLAYSSAAIILEAAMCGDIEELNNFDYL